jgi:TolB protein
MKLKVPLPGRPAGLTAAQTDRVAVSLSWQSAADADGHAVAGYNVYRSTSASGGYSPINAAVVTGITYQDDSVAAGTRYYYTVTSVDSSGDESVTSESVSIVPAAIATNLSGTASGGGGGGCFISSAQKDFNRDVMRGLAVLGVMVILWRLIIWNRICINYYEPKKPD